MSSFKPTVDYLIASALLHVGVSTSEGGSSFDYDESGNDADALFFLEWQPTNLSRNRIKSYDMSFVISAKHSQTDPKGDLTEVVLGGQNVALNQVAMLDYLELVGEEILLHWDESDNGLSVIDYNAISLVELGDSIRAGWRFEFTISILSNDALDRCVLPTKFGS